MRRNRTRIFIILAICVMMIGIVGKNVWKHHGYTISAWFDFNRKMLDIATPYHKGGACHPKVVYFKDSFNGYKYWMVYTPYPNHNSRFENPCVLVSNDLENWKVPQGLTEPCLDDLSANKDRRIYNSDAHLLFNNDTSRLECWWRFVNDRDKEVIIYRRTSENGTEWTPKEIVTVLKNRHKLDYLSLSVVYEEGMYNIWYMFKNKIWLTSTKDLISYTSPKIVDIDYGNGLTPWHLDVEKISNFYEMIYVAYPKKQRNHYNMKLYHCISKDGLRWSQPSVVLEPRKYKSWDNGGIYRSALLKVDDIYHIIYTGWSKNEGVGLGHVQGKDIMNLK